MQGRLVFLLEEPSMKHLLDGLLPRLMPGWVAGEHFLCVPHEGKSDLDRSVPRKLAAWRVPGDRFVVLRDNDSAACQDVKARLTQLCVDSGRADTLIRLVCQELEGWYLGDLDALAQLFGIDAARVYIGVFVFECAAVALAAGFGDRRAIDGRSGVCTWKDRRHVAADGVTVFAAGTCFSVWAELGVNARVEG